MQIDQLTKITETLSKQDHHQQEDPVKKNKRVIKLVRRNQTISNTEEEDNMDIKKYPKLQI